MSARSRAGTRSPSAAAAARPGATRRNVPPAQPRRAAASPPRRGAGWWLVALTLVVPPFVVLPGLLDAFRLPQRMAAEWLALASLLALAGALAALSWRRALAAPAAQAALPLLLVALAGWPLAAHPAHVRDGLADLSIGVAALVGWSLALAAPALRRLLDATVVPGVGLATMAILQLHHLWEPVRFATAPGDARLALTAFAGNPGDLAAVLVLPALVAQARLAEAGRRRAGWAAALLVMVYALAASQTMTALVALLAGSAVLWALRLPRRGLLALLGAAGVALLLVLLVPTLRGRVASLAVAVRSGELDAVLSGRLDGWRVAGALLAEHPLRGVGLGAYRAAFGATKLRLAARGVPFFRGHVNPTFVNAHDEYLEIGAELGVPGLLALAWGILVLLRAGWRARARLDPAGRGLAAGGAVALALLALAYFPFRLAPVAFAWLAAMAWLCAAAGEARAGEEAASAGDEAGSPSPAARPLLLALVALALVGQSARAGARIVASATARAVQQQMSAAAALGRVPGGFVDAELRALARAHRLDPVAIEPLAFRADALLVAHRDEEADAAYRAAIAQEARPETLFNHGLLLWRAGRSDEAVVELRRAVALNGHLGEQLPPGAAPLVERAPLAPLTRPAS